MSGRDLRPSFFAFRHSQRHAAALVSRPLYWASCSRQSCLLLPRRMQPYQGSYASSPTSCPRACPTYALYVSGSLTSWSCSLPRSHTGTHSTGNDPKACLRRCPTIATSGIHRPLFFFFHLLPPSDCVASGLVMLCCLAQGRVAMQTPPNAVSSRHCPYRDKNKQSPMLFFTGINFAPYSPALFPLSTLRGLAGKMGFIKMTATDIANSAGMGGAMGNLLRPSRPSPSHLSTPFLRDLAPGEPAPQPSSALPGTR